MAETTVERRTYEIPEIGRILGVSRNHAYLMAADGTIPGVLRLGSRRLVVSREVFDRWIAGEAEAP